MRHRSVLLVLSTRKASAAAQAQLYSSWLLLALAMLWQAAVSSAQCTVLQLSGTAGSPKLLELDQNRCYTTSSLPEIIRLTSNTIIQANSVIYDVDTAPTLDLNFQLFPLSVGPGVELTIRDVAIKNTYLYPPESGLFLQPVAVKMQPGSVGVYIANSSISTYCEDYMDELLYGTNSTIKDYRMINDYSSFVVQQYTSPSGTFSLHNVSFICSSYDSPSKQSFDIRVTDPSDLRDVLEYVSFIGTGGNVVLPQSLSMARTSWQPGGIVLAKGSGWKVAIVGGDPRGSVLDLRMVGSLVNLSTPGIMSFEDLVMTGLCSRNITLNSNPQFQGYMASSVWAIGSDRSRRTHQVLDTMLVVPEHELRLYQYWSTLLPTCFPRVTDYWSQTVSALIGNAKMEETSILGFTPSSITFGYMKSSKFVWQNVTLTSRVPPSVPLPSTSSYIPQPATECGGRPLANPLLRQLTEAFPLQVVTTSAGLARALVQVSQLPKDVSATAPPPPSAPASEPPAPSSTQLRSYDPPVVMTLLGNCTLSPNMVVGPVVLSRDVVISGPPVMAQSPDGFESMSLASESGTLRPGSPGSVVLDLGNRVDAVELGFADSCPSCLLYITKLVLRGLVKQTLASGEAVTLPLFAFRAPSRSEHQVSIQLHQVTLELPIAEFTKLYALGTWGQNWRDASGAPKAKPGLWQHISGFDLDPIEGLGDSAIYLQNLTGWGINGTSIKLVPAPSSTLFSLAMLPMDLVSPSFPRPPPPLTQPSPQTSPSITWLSAPPPSFGTMQQSKNPSSDFDPWKIAVIAVCIGLAMILAVAVIVLTVRRKGRKGGDGAAGTPCAFGKGRGDKPACGPACDTAGPVDTPTAGGGASVHRPASANNGVIILLPTEGTTEHHCEVLSAAMKKLNMMTSTRSTPSLQHITLSTSGVPRPSTSGTSRSSKPSQSIPEQDTGSIHGESSVPTFGLGPRVGSDTSRSTSLPRLAEHSSTANGIDLAPSSSARVNVEAQYLCDVNHSRRKGSGNGHAASASTSLRRQLSNGLMASGRSQRQSQSGRHEAAASNASRLGSMVRVESSTGAVTDDNGVERSSPNGPWESRGNLGQWPLRMLERESSMMSTRSNGSSSGLPSPLGPRRASMRTTPDAERRSPTGNKIHTFAVKQSEPSSNSNTHLRPEPSERFPSSEPDNLIPQEGLAPLAHAATDTSSSGGSGGTAAAGHGEPPGPMWGSPAHRRQWRSTSYAGGPHSSTFKRRQRHLHQQHRHSDFGGGRGEESLSSPSLPIWDPNKEVQQLAQELQADGDRLVLHEIIGQGGYGTVYRGTWRNLEVAVKTVLFSDKGGAGGGGPKQRAIMEAAVCTSVMHANVVCTYHYDIRPIRTNEVQPAGRLQVQETSAVNDWKLYLVQEYCNASLHAVLKEGILHEPNTKAPNLDLVLTLLVDVARGIQYIHAKSIIHGDLKPENVLLKNDETGAIGVVGKITDFGLATKMSPGATHISNVNNGTPFYAAPEIISSGQLTKASDVYSFGVLMWEMYRGMPPWIKTKQGYAPNPRFRRFPDGSPVPYVLLCAWCLDKNPKARPSLDDLINELQRMLEALLDGYTQLERPEAPTAGQPERHVFQRLQPQPPQYTDQAGPPRVAADMRFQQHPAQASSRQGSAGGYAGGAGDGGSTAAISPRLSALAAAAGMGTEGMAAAVLPAGQSPGPIGSHRSGAQAPSAAMSPSQQVLHVASHLAAQQQQLQQQESADMHLMAPHSTSTRGLSRQASSQSVPNGFQSPLLMPAAHIHKPARPGTHLGFSQGTVVPEEHAAQPQPTLQPHMLQPLPAMFQGTPTPNLQPPAPVVAHPQQAGLPLLPQQLQLIYQQQQWLQRQAQQHQKANASGVSPLDVAQALQRAAEQAPVSASFTSNTTSSTAPDTPTANAPALARHPPTSTSEAAGRDRAGGIMQCSSVPAQAHVPTPGLEAPLTEPHVPPAVESSPSADNAQITCSVTGPVAPAQELSVTADGYGASSTHPEAKGAIRSPFAVAASLQVLPDRCFASTLQVASVDADARVATSAVLIGGHSHNVAALHSSISSGSGAQSGSSGGGTSSLTGSRSRVLSQWMTEHRPPLQRTASAGPHRLQKTVYGDAASILQASSSDVDGVELVAGAARHCHRRSSSSRGPKTVGSSPSEHMPLVGGTPSGPSSQGNSCESAAPAKAGAGLMHGHVQRQIRADDPARVQFLNVAYAEESANGSQ